MNCKFKSYVSLLAADGDRSTMGNMFCLKISDVLFSKFLVACFFQNLLSRKVAVTFMVW